MKNELMNTCAIKPFQRTDCCHKSPEVIFVSNCIPFNVKLYQLNGFEEQYDVPEFLHVDVFLSARFKGFTWLAFV
jgi:hypothetical protein